LKPYPASNHHLALQGGVVVFSLALQVSGLFLNNFKKKAKILEKKNYRVNMLA
jgi:hypothetical protein